MTHLPSLVMRLALVVVTGSLALAGCGGGDEPEEGTATPSSSGSRAAQSPSSPTVDPNDAYGLDLPSGVQLTALGTDLKVGDTARVAWEPNKKTVGVIAVTVKKLRKGTLKDFAGFTLDDQTSQSTPYYVDARVKNIGRSDLSGVATPLYLLDGDDVLFQASTFQSTFTPCAAKPLPEKFKAGKSADVCLVFIAADHGALKAISFRPTQKYASIEWTGQLSKDKPTKGPTAQNSSGNGG